MFPNSFNSYTQRTHHLDIIKATAHCPNTSERLTNPPNREMVSYSMTKAAALAFHEGLSSELRGEKLNAPEIKLTCVHPTWSSTAMIAPHRADIDASGMTVIEPYVVADAVVKQVLSGRGRQLILAPGVEFLSTMRSWPSWFVRALNGITGT
jgi:short-subunit dehydrogenase